MANTHDLGDLVRVTAEFRDPSTNAYIEPTIVKLSVKTPDGTVTTYVYDTDASMKRTDIGQYYSDLNANAAGRWYYRWWSTGTGQAADENYFDVEAAEAV